MNQPKHRTGPASSPAWFILMGTLLSISLSLNAVLWAISAWNLGCN